MHLLLYHASNEVVEFPEVRKTKYTKDFSWGFYCTTDFEHAVRWANRGEGNPIINYYSYEPNNELSILKCFHTLSALNCLAFDRSEIVYDRKRKK